MKLLIKTVNGQQQFHLEVQPPETVLDVKKKLESQGQGDASLQKLIHSGKILVDEKTLADYGVEEGSFLVVITSKAPAKPAAAVPAPAAAPSATPAPAPAAAAPAPAAPAAAPPAAPPASAANPAGNAAVAQSQRASGAQLEANVLQLMEMGFERDQVVRALHAAFENPDRAAEYLMSGQVPEFDDEGDADAQSPQSGDAGGVAPGEGETPLSFLRTNPQFAVLLQLVRSNPAAAPAVLQALGQQNPEVLRLIAENQAEFQQLLAEPADPATAAAMQQMMGGAGGGGGGGGGVAARPTIQITQAEKEAIERLCALGFPRDAALQAYFACDKNEELAANFLFENGFD